MGYLNGGVSVVLAETAATAGARMNIDQDIHMVMGVEINAHHVRGYFYHG
jgi:1,4-dihydroxy-2-naphthoyl-CoA hydrolase